jgi:LmbE family N-acetylglucosaminyl deacetylase
MSTSALRAAQRALPLLALLAMALPAAAQTPRNPDAVDLPAPLPTGPRVLIVDAHPDDESAYAATVYKITHDLNGRVDLLLVTNGEAGYKYSTLAEPIYGVELTDEKVGREYLPTIRKRETMAAGNIVGIRNFFFLDQLDNQYTQNVDSVLRYVWDVPEVKKRIGEIITKGNYDYIFTLLPVPETHGHHKGATILALEVVKEMTGRKPIVLGGGSARKNDTTQTRFTELAGYPVTRVSSGQPSFFFDRTVKFGFHDALDYRIIVNWLIAEHKSQGTMQTYMNQGEIETYWWYDINDPAARPAAQQLFERLKVIPYKKRTY